MRYQNGKNLFESKSQFAAFTKAAMTIDIVWKSISIQPTELSLSKVLRCGQTFRWKNVNDIWSFTLQDRIVLLKQDEEKLQYASILRQGLEKKPAMVEKETEEFVKDYFNLDTNLSKLYSHWSFQHQKYASKKSVETPFTKYAGIRILRQDPWETTISFICSSNNNVKRISKMCDNLCTEFGDYINTHQGIRYYSFPKAEVLAENPNVETKLRNLGFGYRAKYIYQTALKLTNGELSINTLYDLRNRPYQEAHDYLLNFTGVGPKVADCICLMALDKHDVVPVDTHVYQIAIRDYKFKPSRNLKTMNKEIYSKIRLHFKDIFGPYAGWAQSVLFASDLVDLNNGINVVEQSISVDVDDKKIDLKESKVEMLESYKKRVKLN